MCYDNLRNHEKEREMEHKIIAVVGMCGSGKSEVTKFFEEDGYHRVYFGGVTMKELEKRGLEKNEANERLVREELRTLYGKAAFAKLLIPEIETHKDTNVVLDGLYSWSEYILLKQRFPDMIVVSVVTDAKIRKERLKNRPVRPLTAEQVDSRDIAEIEQLEKGGPIAIADYFILNNGSWDELKKQYIKIKESF